MKKKPKIVTGWPPNINEIQAVFPLPRGVIFTYGDRIYNPYGGKLPPWLIEHEKVHIQQQLRYGVAEWWSRYLIDAPWRLSQEMEAHRMEYRVYCAIIRDVRKRKVALIEMARRLSGPMYGGLISLHEAKENIGG